MSQNGSDFFLRVRVKNSVYGQNKDGKVSLPDVRPDVHSLNLGWKKKKLSHTWFIMCRSFWCRKLLP